MITDISRTNAIAGTCLQGYITATREQLATVFGAPNSGDDYKFFFHWNIEITENDGTKTVATIYDWKYDRIVSLDEIVEWNIGGYNHEATRLIEDALCSKLGLRVTYTKARSAR